MSQCFIRKSTFGKWHIATFFLALTQIIINVFDKFYFIHRKNYILESYSKALGEIAIILVPQVEYSYYFNKKEKAKAKCSITKKICLDHFILLFLYTLYNTLIIGCFLINDNNNSEEKTVLNLIAENLSTKEGIEIIFLTIVMKLLIKYPFFKHHYLSIKYSFINLFLLFK